MIPCRNAADTLGQQLAALADQAWDGEWEVILADNGSTDETRSVASVWAERLPSLRVVDASARRGAAHARNRGAEAATGAALLFCDADDVVAPGWLRAMAEALERQEFCASRFEYARLNPGRPQLRGSKGSQENGLQQLWYSPHVPHAGGSGLSIWRSLHVRLGGFDESLLYLQDTDYCIRAAQLGVSLAFVDDAVVHVRLRDTSGAVLHQARAWARTNCHLYARYRTEAEDWKVSWLGYLYGWWMLARALSHRRIDRVTIARRAGWKLGLLEGSLLHRVAPPDFRHGVQNRPPWIASPGSPRNRRWTLAEAPRRVAKEIRRRVRRVAKSARRRRMGTLISVATRRPVAALTFDDGPDPRFTPALLELLDAHSAKATFFVVGERAARYPELVRHIRERGHAIGNHSWSHRSVHDMSSDELVAEIRRTEAAVEGNGGRWFRPPYGQLSPGAWRTARSLGYEVVGWSLMSGDWRPVEPETLAATLLEEIRPGAIVLLHDGLVRPTVEEGRDRRFMLAGLDAALSSLSGRFEFVRIDELLAAGRPRRRAFFPSGRSGKDGAADADRRESTQTEPEQGSPRGIEGTLRIATFGAQPAPAEEPAGVEHRTAYVRDRHYRGMEDNDVRGYLDGGFQWAWNQPSQVHVRIGRPGWEESGGSTPRFGEHELFRVLQRWDGIRLPAGARVDRGELVLHVENGCERPLEVNLYEVRRDWNPGEGGTLRNNLSPPAPGEVWWNEAVAGEAPWAKPGAGHASDTDPNADTGTMPLATVHYRPGDTRLRFVSAALARYVESRVAGGRPLLFMVKLSDVDEDVPGSHLAIYSANCGDSWNASRRPKLLLRWRSPAERRVMDLEVRLEYGRALDLGAVAGSEEVLLLFEWLPATRSRRPSVWSGVPDDWAPADSGREPAVGPSEVSLARPIPALGSEYHLLAAENVVALGGTFRSSIRDTWVISGPPETQVVDWMFIAPSGRRVAARADYVGDFRWMVELKPDEIGRWRYFWTHRFGWEPTRGTGGSIDVVAMTMVECIRFLEGLAAEIQSAGDGEPGDRAAWMSRFLRLERAAIALLEPAAWRGSEGEAVREAVKGVRAALWGRPMPEEFPLEAHDLVTERDGFPLRDPYPRRPAPKRPDEPGRLLQKLGTRLAWNRPAGPREGSTTNTGCED